MCRQSNKHYWRPRLCRVFLHSAKSPLHSAKALPSVALGKVRSAKFFSAKGLCRVLFIRALGKIKIFFAECLERHSTKYFRPLRRRPLTVILPSARPSTRQKKYFFKKLLCRVPQPRHSAKFFYFFKKKTLPSVPTQALGKVFFFKKITLPSAPAQALGKVFFIFFKIISLPSVPV